MNTTAIHGILERNANKPGPATAKFLAWCARVSLPDALAAHFATCSIKSRDGGVGCLRFEAGTGIMSYAEEFPVYLNAGLLVFGSCPNGDMIALDIRDSSFPVAFLSHGAMWDNDPFDPRQHMIVVAPHLEDFLAEAERGDGPSDYHEAVAQRDAKPKPKKRR